MLSAGRSVVLIDPISIPNFEVTSIASRDLVIGPPVVRPLCGLQPHFLQQYSAPLARFEARHDIEFVRLDAALCGDGRCSCIVEGRALFAEDNPRPPPSRFAAGWHLSDAPVGVGWN